MFQQIIPPQAVRGLRVGCGVGSFVRQTSCNMLNASSSRYMCSLSFFHYSEYLVTAVINPRSLSLDSFLLNHSLEYTLAAMSSWLEFTVEKLTVPGAAACRFLLCELTAVGLYVVFINRMFEFPK